ncbi:hypothetical protein [Aeromonas phage AS-zj]|uniref:Uncharacterized protein n=4 Tax=Caudoviricetes TaxID=2731619 RepID=A0A411B8E4_9CAUD|nr:hypothetical protein HWB28_gp390 [Aeromonas phage AS-zj]YP_009834714.1 hypothetical protein HWB29_gp012 [Aeromonas phage AS-sw]QAX97873.1 hypothetical protein ASswx1_230 [Aeromonas phage Asswx_1]QMV29104.1 hypothetical protein AP1_0397 [Aeromonas phage AP1]ASU00162.1 hypothetical protein [Aeromonas phage AS-zj]ATI18062.1 hypothetical protein [Aeromonas phage AS-sw]
MEYNFIEVNENIFVLTGYFGSYNLIERWKRLEEDDHLMIVKIKEYLGKGNIVVVHDVQEDLFVKLDGDKFYVF